MKRLPYFFALSVGLFAFTGIEVNAATQPTPLVSAFEATDEILMASRLRNRGFRFRVRSSRYRRGGFARGSCPEGAAPIVPVAEDADAAPKYLTASAHPTFFIHVPQMPNASGFIYVEDPNSTGRNPQLYKAAFSLGNQAGIVGIQMPTNAPLLEEGSTYRWRVVIDCSAEDADENTVVFSGGEIERVADIEGTTEERLDYYLQEGIWQETAEILAEYRLDNQNASTDEDWAILMTESGLPQFADASIVDIMDGRLSED